MRTIYKETLKLKPSEARLNQTSAASLKSSWESGAQPCRFFLICTS